MSVRHIFDVDWYLNLTLKKKNLFTCCSSKIQSDGGTNYSSWLTVSSASVHQVLIGKWNQAMFGNMKIKFYQLFSVWFIPLRCKPRTVPECHRSCASRWVFLFVFVKILARKFLKQYENDWVCDTKGPPAIRRFQKFTKDSQLGVRWQQLLDFSAPLTSQFLPACLFLPAFLFLPRASFASLVFVFEDASGGVERWSTIKDRHKAWFGF